MGAICLWAYSQPVEQITAKLARELGKRGKKVFVLDLNLEAPTLQFELEDVFKKKLPVKRGLVGIIHDRRNQLETALDENCIPVAETVKFLPTGDPARGGYWQIIACEGFHNVISCTYVQHVARFFDRDSLSLKELRNDKKYRIEDGPAGVDVYTDERRKSAGYEFFTALKEATTVNQDYVLINSPRGHNTLSGVALRILANSAVFYLTPRRGEIIGTNILLVDWEQLGNSDCLPTPKHKTIISDYQFPKYALQSLNAGLKEKYAVHKIDLDRPASLLNAITPELIEDGK